MLTQSQTELIRRITIEFEIINRSKPSYKGLVLDVDEILDYVNRKANYIAETNALQTSYKQMLADKIKVDMEILSNNVSPLGFKVNFAKWDSNSFFIYAELVDKYVKIKYEIGYARNQEFDVLVPFRIQITSDGTSYKTIEDVIVGTAQYIKDIYVSQTFKNK